MLTVPVVRKNIYYIEHPGHGKKVSSLEKTVSTSQHMLTLVMRSRLKGLMSRTLGIVYEH